MYRKISADDDLGGKYAKGKGKAGKCGSKKKIIIRKNKLNWENTRKGVRTGVNIGVRRRGKSHFRGGGVVVFWRYNEVIIDYSGSFPKMCRPIKAFPT